MSASPKTYDLDLLQKSQLAWARSASLRVYYCSLFREMKGCCRGREILELGSGIAASRSVFDNLVTSDIEKTEFVDREMSAYDVEVQEDGHLWSDIFAVDMLHHLQEPLRFIESAASVLQEKGRIILMEPAATPGGRVFYGLFHHEPIEMKEVSPPFTFPEPNHQGGFANMGMAVGLFVNNRQWMEDWLSTKGLRIESIRYRDLLAYPLTGGYSKPSLLPAFLIAWLLRLEGKLPQWILARLGLRLCITLTKMKTTLS